MKGTLLESLPEASVTHAQRACTLASEPNIFFHAKNLDGQVHTKGRASCLLGHRIAADPDDGIFAEWQWDGERLTAKNGRYGFYPVYYYARNKEFVLSPTIKRILESGADASLDYPALAVFLRLGFFIGEDTPFKHIKALPPSADLRWQNSAACVTSRLRRLRKQTHIGARALTHPPILVLTGALQQEFQVVQRH